MFNTLNSIARLALFENAPRTQDLTVHLAEYLRYVLHRQAHGELVPLRMELDCIRRYLAIYEVRFGDRLRTRLEADPQTEELLVPFMLLQPLVENALSHGIEPLPQGGEIAIRTLLERGLLVVEVADDGMGFDPSGASRGVGIANVEERLRLHYGEAARFEVDSAFGHGTRIRLVLPPRKGGW